MVCTTAVCPFVTTVTHNSEVRALEVVYVLVVPSVIVTYESMGNVVTGEIGGDVKAVDGSGLPLFSTGAVVVTELVAEADDEALAV